jgi:hypothetical protein
MFPARSFPLCMLMSAILSLVLITAFATPGDGHWGSASCCGCQQTWCAWSATWHGPYALDTPLRGYYIPRMPGRCDRGVDFAAGESCCCGESVLSNPAGQAGQSCGYPPAAGFAFEPVQLERLGQVPNDLEPGGLTSGEPPNR